MKEREKVSDFFLMRISTKYSVNSAFLFWFHKVFFVENEARNSNLTESGKILPKTWQNLRSCLNNSE